MTTRNPSVIILFILGLAFGHGVPAAALRVLSFLWMCPPRLHHLLHIPLNILYRPRQRLFNFLDQILPTLLLHLLLLT